MNLTLYWPPIEDGNNLQAARKRLLIVFCILSSVGSILPVVFKYIGLADPTPTQIGVALLGCLYYQFCPLLIAKRINTSLLAYIFVGSAFISASLKATQTGGILSTNAASLLAILAGGALILGWRKASVIFAATIIAYILLFEFINAGTPTHDASKRMLVALIVTSIFIMAFTSVFQNEIKAANESLYEARTAAEAATKSKGRFLANMSHEIRTPMNGVLGMSELLLRSELNEKQKMFAEAIHNSGLALLTIINDILDFSRIEEGKLDLEAEPFNLSASIDDVTTLLGVSARSKSVDLMVRYRPDAPKWVIGDASRLRQAMMNLAGNAVKFTSEGSVTIDVSCTTRDNIASFRISVTDTGVGIPADRLEAIFTQFTQAESSTTRKYGGTGLGLPITRRLVEAMGGKVRVQSELFRGSTFFIDLELPIADEEKLVRQQQCTPLYGVAVVVVAENLTNRQIIVEQLESMGAAPVLAANRAELIAILRGATEGNEPAPLTLIDFHLNDLNGLTLAKAIRSDVIIQDTPIIVLTSIDSEQIARDFNELGVIKLLSKPTPVHFLKEAIVTLLSDANAASLDSITDHLSEGTQQRNAPKKKRLLTENFDRRGQYRQPTGARKYDRQPTPQTHIRGERQGSS